MQDLLHPLVLGEDALAAAVDADQLLLEEVLRVRVRIRHTRRMVRAGDAHADLRAADLDQDVGDGVGAGVAGRLVGDLRLGLEERRVLAEVEDLEAHHLGLDRAASGVGDVEERLPARRERGPVVRLAGHEHEEVVLERGRGLRELAPDDAARTRDQRPEDVVVGGAGLVRRVLRRAVRAATAAAVGLRGDAGLVSRCGVTRRAGLGEVRGTDRRDGIGGAGGGACEGDAKRREECEKSPGSTHAGTS
jgi:hypothetical protein